ncbi:hypothetical protein CR513_03744, partial [Mucuna pruriens]
MLFCKIFDVWGIDFMRPFPVSYENSSIQLNVDYVLRWVEARATKANDAKTIVDFVKSNIFCKFGVQKALTSDTLWTHKTAYRTPLGMSPYHIFFDKACHLPKCNLVYDQAGQERKLQLQELEELRLEAYENSRIYKEKVKQFHDSKILRKEFRVDQKILLFNSRLKLIVGKHHFVVTNIFPYGVVEVRDDANNCTFKVNRHQLKPYYKAPNLSSNEGEVEIVELIKSVIPEDTLEELK